MLTYPLVVTSILLFSVSCYGFYVPGVAPTDFTVGEEIEVRAIKMTSTHTQLPYDYYSLAFCRPQNGLLEYKSQNLGEILRGDRIVKTPYNIKMKTNVPCASLCQPLDWDAKASSEVNYRIQEEYFVHLIIDNLPIATQFSLATEKEPQYEPGYRLGFMYNGQSYINNHLKFILSYHMNEAILDSEGKQTYRVVGFRVETSSLNAESVKLGENGVCEIKTDSKQMEIVKDKANKVIFTYSVVWEESNIRWASRWDIYLNMADVQIHWFSIVNSIVVVFFLAGIIAMIIVRTLRRDISRYNMDDDLEESIEETGWKLVHGEVFRPPTNTRLFAAVIGSGIQLLCMTAITIFFAMLGMLSPASRGGILTAAIFLYEFMGLVSGYLAGRLYKTMKGKEWKRAAFLTATLYPGEMGAMWFGISLPLVYIGYYFGYRKKAYDQPVRNTSNPSTKSQPKFGIWIPLLLEGSGLEGDRLQNELTSRGKAQETDSKGIWIKPPQRKSNLHNMDLHSLRKKEQLEERCNEIEAAYEVNKHELQVTQEALAKFQSSQQVSTRTGIEHEESLLTESAARESSLNTQIIDMELDIKYTKSEVTRLQTEKERIEQEYAEVIKLKEIVEKEFKEVKAELKDYKYRENRHLIDYSELEEENIALQKQIIGLRSSQVEFEGAKHEIRHLQEEVDILNEQNHEMTNLKKIAEKQLEEALESLQAEREQRYMLKKELDSKLNSENMNMLGNLALSIQGMTTSTTGSSTIIEGGIHVEDEEDGPIFKKLEDVTAAAAASAPDSGPTSDLFSEIHFE
ncbi:TM9SF2_4 [Lepeophtheirus salmonis]|uniref:Transmembrane 9 superfamily member n=1 Tax=Lepeophtheirus salmonis TaxID=72036 RepID=A0A7R8CH70_LEPSM|nr:TM9SF2_4 [Lepeophtheirus salmonis]CAF2782740.1 TM9SF2_4 [Lepeophtheirus salmonis]